MSDLTRLRELADQFPPPDLDDLVRVATRRRRRSAYAAVTGAAASVLAVVVLVTSLGGPAKRTSDPVDPPEPSPTPTWDAGEWPPERVRAEGTAERWDLAQWGTVGQAMPVARLWTACRSERCSPFHDGGRDQHIAVEVSMDGFRTGSLFDFTYSYPRCCYLIPYDADTVFARDVEGARLQESRFRLLDADGTEARLELIDGTAPAAPGPDVVHATDMALYRVDLAAGTLQELAQPPYVTWGPPYDDVLWGIGPGCQVVWMGTDEVWQERPLPGCRRASRLADPLPEGVMGIVVQHGPRGPSTVVSRDQGETWTSFEGEIDLTLLEASDALDVLDLGG